MPQTIQPKSITVAVPIIFAILKHFFDQAHRRIKGFIHLFFGFMLFFDWLLRWEQAVASPHCELQWVISSRFVFIGFFLTLGAKKKVQFNQYLQTSISRSQSWERDSAERKFCDILKGWSLVLLDWQPTRDRLSLKAEQLLAASFSQRGLSLFCFNQTLQSCLTAPLRLMSFNCSP